MPTCFVYGKDYYRGQPADVNLMHGYLLWTDRPGDFVKKPVRECTGNEILTEIFYHYGLDEDQIKETLKQTYVSVAAMPYITSQFMPRRIADRPQVIPDGCVNLAFIGQYVETPADVSFTVESSVRTAMMAVWGLTGLQKPQVPMYEPILRRAGHREIAPDGGRERHSEPRCTRQSQERHGRVHRETGQCSAQAHARALVVLTERRSSRRRLPPS